MENLTAIQKATYMLADLTTGGLLSPEQYLEFVEIPIKSSVLIGMVRVEQMGAPTKELSKAEAQARILFPGTEGNALQVAQRTKAATSKTTLTSKLYRGAAPVTDEVLEDNITKERFQTMVRDLAGKAVKRDMEDIAINSDTSSSDPTLALQDGYIKLITTNLVAAGGIRLSKTTLRDMDLLMPDAFRRDPSEMRFLTSHKAAVWYRDSIAQRIGDVGDNALLRGDADPQRGYANYNGTQIVPVPLFPSNLGGGLNESPVLYTDPKNLLFGIQRDVRVEFHRDPMAGTNYLIVSVRIGINVLHEQMSVKATGVLVG